jgi:hypothetical protein
MKLVEASPALPSQITFYELASTGAMAAIAEVPISLEGGNAKVAEFAKQISAEGELLMAV